MGLAVHPRHRADVCERSGKDKLAKGEAKSLAKIMGRRNRSGNFGAYKCRGCGSWHVGARRYW